MIHFKIKTEDWEKKMNSGQNKVIHRQRLAEDVFEIRMLRNGAEKLLLLLSSTKKIIIMSFQEPEAVAG